MDGVSGCDRQAVGVRTLRNYSHNPGAQAKKATYVVGHGDTLTNIAKQFHTSVGAIVATNQIEDPDALTEGQQLTMPPPSAVRIEAKLVDEGGDAAIGLTLVGAEPWRNYLQLDLRHHPARRQHVHRITALDVDLRRRHDDLHGHARDRQLLRHRHQRARAHAETAFHLDPTRLNRPGTADEP